MKKILFVFSVALTCLFFSCSSKQSGKLSAKAQKNLDAFHTISNAFLTGDASKIDDVVAADYVSHMSGQGNRDSLKAMIAWMHGANKDMKMEVKKEFADEDYVCSWSHYMGVSNGTGGMPDGPYDMAILQVAKFKDGKAIEYWEFMEPAEMMKMLGGGAH